MVKYEDAASARGLGCKPSLPNSLKAQFDQQSRENKKLNFTIRAYLEINLL